MYLLLSSRFVLNINEDCASTTSAFSLCWLSFKCLISAMLTFHSIANKPFRGAIKTDQYFIYEFLPNLPIHSRLHERKGS